MKTNYLLIVYVDMEDFVADVVSLSFCRWYQATKSTNQAMAAKVDSLKDEMDEALNKVESCKVGLALDQELFIRLASLPIGRGVNSARLSAPCS